MLCTFKFTKKKHITKESDLLYKHLMLLTMIQMMASVGDDFYQLACSPSPFLISKCNDNGDGNKNVIKKIGLMSKTGRLEALGTAHKIW